MQTVELLGGWRDNKCTAAAGRTFIVTERRTRIWGTTTCHFLRKLGGCKLKSGSVQKVWDRESGDMDPVSVFSLLKYLQLLLFLSHVLSACLDLRKQ